MLTKKKRYDGISQISVYSAPFSIWLKVVQTKTQASVEILKIFLLILFIFLNLKPITEKVGFSFGYQKKWSTLSYFRKWEDNEGIVFKTNHMYLLGCCYSNKFLVNVIKVIL